MKQRFCIFCQGNGLSKEHFWPDWLKDYIETTHSDKHTTEVYSGDVKSNAELEKKNKRPGNLITKKFRVVCTNCNNEWMSELEEKAKPFILSAIKNKKLTLNKDELLLFTKWIVMKVMVAEHNHDGTQVTPAQDLKEFYKNQTIPSYYRVYIGRHNTDTSSAYCRHSCTLARTMDGPVCSMEGMERNTQSVSFLIGPLFIFVYACREQDTHIWRDIKLNQMTCIYPSERKSLQLSSIKLINSARISVISNSLEDIINSPSIKYGGNLK